MATIGMIFNAGSQAFVWGPLLDKLKKTAAFIYIGEFAAGLGHFVIYWVYKYFLEIDHRYAGFAIIIGLSVIESFWSASNVGFSALISEKTSDHERKKLMAQLSVIGGLGGILGATLGGQFYRGGLGFETGWLFYFVGIVMIVSSLVVIIGIKDGREDKTENNKSPDLSELDPNVRRTFYIFLLALMIINFGRNSIALISGLFLKTGFDATDEQVALFRNVAGGATLIFGIILGGRASKLDDQKILIVGTIFAILGVGYLGLAPDFTFSLIAAAFIGASMVIINASSYAVAAHLIPAEYRGRLFAFYNATFFLSWGLGATFFTAPIADYLINRGSSDADAYRVSFIAAVLMTVVGLFVLFYSYRRIACLELDECDD
jgi:MFS family permease